jgi:hypothetical protein
MRGHAVAQQAALAHHDHTASGEGCTPLGDGAEVAPDCARDEAKVLGPMVRDADVDDDGCFGSSYEAGELCDGDFVERWHDVLLEKSASRTRCFGCRLTRYPRETPRR